MHNQKDIAEMASLLREVGEAYCEMHEPDETARMMVTNQLAGIMGALLWVLGKPTPVTELLRGLKEGIHSGWTEGMSGSNGTIH